jgi:hypothetical protein
MIIKQDKAIAITALAFSALLVPACASKTSSSDAADTSQDSEIVAQTTISQVCGFDTNSTLHAQGVTYVAICPAALATTGTIARIDLVTGARTDLGTYPAGQSVYFEDVGAKYAIWYSSIPFTGGITRPPTTIGVWDQALASTGAHTFVADDVLTPTSFVGDTSQMPYGMIGYAGNGKVLTAWDRITPKIALIDILTGAISWQSDAPSLRSFSSTWIMTTRRSDDGSKWALSIINESGSSTFVDVSGTSPRVVPLVKSITPSPLFSWRGDFGPWDGKRSFIVHTNTAANGAMSFEYALLDLDTLVQTPLGETTDMDPNGLANGRPAVATDGSIAYYTWSGTATAQQHHLEILAPNALQSTKRDVATTLDHIAYVAPGGGWAIASEELPIPPHSATDRPVIRKWLIDMTATAAAPVQIAESYEFDVHEEASTVTLRYDSQATAGHSILRQVSMNDGSLGPEIDVAGYAAVLSSNHVLTNGCVATITGATLTSDPAAGCLTSDQQRMGFENVSVANSFFLHDQLSSVAALILFNY